MQVGLGEPTRSVTGPNAAILEHMVSPNPQNSAIPPDISEVYADRNQAAMLAAAFALALGCKVGWRMDPNEPEYPVLLIDLPDGVGQISYHVPEQQATQFDIGPYPGEWDGHSTAEKRRRIAVALGAAEQSAVPRMFDE